MHVSDLNNSHKAQGEKNMIRQNFGAPRISTLKTSANDVFFLFLFFFFTRKIALLKRACTKPENFNGMRVLHRAR